MEVIRELIKLADHGALIAKYEKCFFAYRYGADAMRAPDQPRHFFLPQC